MDLITIVLAFLEFLLGGWLMMVGLKMSLSRAGVTHEVTSTKKRNALLGTGVGAGAGLLTSSIIGGIGIATGGIGIGLGAIGLALLGGGAGAAVGAATGNTQQTISKTPIFSKKYWLPIIVGGVALLLEAIIRFSEFLSAYLT